MAEVHQLTVHTSAVGSLRPVSSTLQDLLKQAGFKDVAPSPEKEFLATTAATFLAGSYKDVAAASAEAFHLAWVMTLAEYPDDCIRYVTDPRTGIQSFKYTVFDHTGREVKGKFKTWPPNPGELQEACEKYMLPIRRREEREQRAREESEERRAEEVRAKAVEPGMRKAIEAYRASPERRAGFADELAAKIMRQIEHGTSARRVEEDLARRRAARAL